MEIVLEIFKYILPSVVVFTGVYLIMQSFFDNELKKKDKRAKVEALKNSSKQLTPVRLQAYERMILYLERINLSNLVMRMPNKNTSALELQRQMLATIRMEYEHNMAQQLYISSQSWKILLVAKEESIKVINSCAEKLDSSATAMDLSRFILEVMGKTKNSPTDVAIEALKRDIHAMF